MSAADRWRWPALLAWAGLFAWLLAWIVWLAPPPASLQAPALVVALGPLVWFRRGMLAGEARTHATVAVLASIYLAHGAFEWTVASVSPWLPGLQIALAATLLVSAAFHARARGRAARAALATRPGPLQPVADRHPR
jgi:uncharacterized membrane protein